MFSLNNLAKHACMKVEPVCIDIVQLKLFIFPHYKRITSEMQRYDISSASNIKSLRFVFVLRDSLHFGCDDEIHEKPYSWYCQPYRIIKKKKNL